MLRENDTFINVRKIEENGDLANVNIYKVVNKTHLQSVRHAEKAIYLKEQQWQLENVAQSDISLDKIKANASSMQTWQSSIAPDLVKMAVVIPDNLSLVDLFHYIHFLKNNQQKSRSFELAFWGRMVNPFVTFVMLMVATPFVIGIKRGINVGGRIMIGIVIGLSFNILDQIAGHVGLIYDLNPLVVAVTPSVLLCLASVYALKKMVFN
jgi:lipopolysaccharide export system permease protein